jgi:hypothetical protein
MFQIDYISNCSSQRFYGIFRFIQFIIIKIIGTNATVLPALSNLNKIEKKVRKIRFDRKKPIRIHNTRV